MTTTPTFLRLVVGAGLIAAMLHEIVRLVL